MITDKVNIAFTVCTANYLAHAKGMADSLIRHNPSYTCYVCLLDEVNGRFDESLFSPHQIISIKDLDIPPFEDMRRRYSLLELSCALKPWFALHLLKATNSRSLFHFDTDILIFNSLVILEQILQEQSILLTPHIMNPLPVDDKGPQEKSILRTGNYNAGFFALNNDENGIAFLEWWRRTLIDNCYENQKGLYASDQKWLNFVPLFFKKVAIVAHPGSNLAYWNIHERELTWRDNNFWVNGTFELLFIHYSGYKYTEPSVLSRHQSRYDLNLLPVWQQICEIYVGELKKNKVDFFSTLDCVYKKKKLLGLF